LILARFRERKRWLLWSLTVLALDQCTKRVVESQLPYPISLEIIPGFFHLSHVKNTGAAFGLLAEFGAERGPWLLVLTSLLALGFVGTLLARTPQHERRTLFALASILGGAIGNLLDRLFRGAVTDFLGVYIGSYRWPDFNVADSAISVGMVLLLLDSLRVRRDRKEKDVVVPTE
jgi:signal peptidase II